MAHDQPPVGWKQKVRRGLPFAPGRDAEQFETIITRMHERYELNLSTLEVFHDRGAAGWDQPSWTELPDVVRDRIHSAHETLLTFRS